MHGELVMVVEDLVCSDCFHASVEPLLDGALRHEWKYPPHWGTAEVKPYKFAKLLPPGFVRSYIDREEEYSIPYSDRLYCAHRCPNTISNRPEQAAGLENLTSDRLILEKLTTDKPSQESSPTEISHSDVAEACDRFLGAKKDLGGQTITCTSCRGLVCGSCAAPILGDEKQHCCQIDGTAAFSEDSFQGLKRGEDYQQCPNTLCGMKVYLDSGCNHMVCTKCRVNFCYICGEVARPGAGHWMFGSPCPRYNQPGAGNAQHDEEFEEALEEEFLDTDGDSEDDEEAEEDWVEIEDEAEEDRVARVEAAMDEEMLHDEEVWDGIVRQLSDMAAVDPTNSDIPIRLASAARRLAAIRLEAGSLPEAHDGNGH
ncbi:hypothetical protein LTR36_001217 [Oleoguttula mirabilis]|uniref:RBR-type E3 ubiquitin transferase n=1 Tax=Oleoguttula mirabilis TaxID=1507867 RepID=A0AAV9JPR8_9PEZI|nr:hypothetical protein LTR36_001217 [Oleoguttula mirabilis]